MRQWLTILAVLAGLAAGSAQAKDDCFVPMADWQPREAALRVAVENGWTVRRIRIDDGCYQIDGRDETGRRIEAKLNPATLDVVDVEYEGQEHGHEAKGSRDD